MFNTNTPENSWWSYVDAKKGFVVEAARDITAGEQIFDWYGTKCNTDFLKNYADPFGYFAKNSPDPKNLSS